MFFLLCCSLLNLHIFIIHVFNRFFMLYVVKIGYVNKIDLRYNLVYFMFFKFMYISVSTTVCPFFPLLHLSLCPYVLAESGSSSSLFLFFSWSVALAGPHPPPLPHAPLSYPLLNLARSVFTDGALLFLPLPPL